MDESTIARVLRAIDCDPGCWKKGPKGVLEQGNKRDTVIE